MFLLLYEHVRVRVRVVSFITSYHKDECRVLFFFFGFVQPRNKRVVSYDLHSTQTDCRSCSLELFLMCTTLLNVPWLCASIQEEPYAISSWSTTAASTVNIA